MGLDQSGYIYHTFEHLHLSRTSVLRICLGDPEWLHPSCQ